MEMAIPPDLSIFAILQNIQWRLSVAKIFQILLRDQSMPLMALMPPAGSGLGSRFSEGVIPPCPILQTPSPSCISK